MTCDVCNHEHRAEIENAIFSRNLGEKEISLEEIAREFSVKIRDLQVHALMHTPMGSVVGDTAPDSLVARAKVSEAEILRATALEYYTTLKNIGSKINSLISPRDANLSLITANIVNLYIESGHEVRATIETLMKLNEVVNGGEDGGVKALGNLIKAIQGSPTKEESSYVSENSIDSDSII